MQASFMERLQALRVAFNKPILITSGYRHPSHPIEAEKDEPGAHASGHACDIAVMGADALDLVGLAIQYGFTGIGVSQKGQTRFIHLDDLEHEDHRPRPWLWSY